LSDIEKQAGFKIEDGKKRKMSTIERKKRENAAEKGAKKADRLRRISTKKRLTSIKKRPRNKEFQHA
jgi:hypothetical protein